MKKLFTSFILILLVLGFVSIGLCKNQTEKIQYSNYEWGMKKSKVKELIKEKGNKIIDKKENFLIYYDKFFGKKGEVMLSFTEISDKLFSIVILIEDKNLVKDFKPIFKNKYGSYKIKINYENKEIKYLWNGCSIMFNYKKNDTFLGYGSSKYTKLNKKEEKKIKQKQTDKF